MATVGIRNPVAALHPVTGQYVTLSRGVEFDDNDPVVAEYPWAFVDEDAPVTPTSVPIGEPPAPVEKRRGRRS